MSVTQYSRPSSNPRRQTSTTQGHKSWSHGMTFVSTLEVNILYVCIFEVLGRINISGHWRP